MKLTRSGFPLILLLIVALIAICGFDGCNGNGNATITFHQVGSCNGWDDGHLHSAGSNAAYVVFRVQSIDNTNGTVDFNFDPAKMYVNTGSQPHMDSSLSLAQFMGVQALAPTTVTKGVRNGLFTGFSVAIVSTSNSNGAIEANQTAYSLGYNTGSSDPGILFNMDKTWTPLASPTEDCTKITYQ